MIFWDKSPATTVRRIIPVIAEHHVIIHLKLIHIGLFPIYIDLAIFFYLQIISLIITNHPFINRQIVLRKFQYSTPFGNPNRPVIGTGPFLIIS